MAKLTPLEALEEAIARYPMRNDLYEIIRTALSGEPVAWIMRWPDGGICNVTLNKDEARAGGESGLTAQPLFPSSDQSARIAGLDKEVERLKVERGKLDFNALEVESSWAMKLRDMAEERDKYKAEALIKRALASDNVISENCRLRQETAGLKARIAKAEEVMKPFADMQARISDPDSPDKDRYEPKVSVGLIEAAAQFIEESGK